MKRIKDYTKLPKFLQVSKWQIDQSYNKYLPKPYVLGEIVKTQPAEVQKPDHKFDHITPRVPPCTDEFWQERYCRILRKDANGKFTHSCVLEWQALDYLQKKAK